MHEDIQYAFIGGMKQDFESLDSSFGDPNTQGVTFPPLVDKIQYDRVKAYVDGGKSEATPVTGGVRMFENVWPDRLY